MIRVVVIGALGRMGQAVCDAVEAEDDMTLVAAVDPSFSSEEALEAFGMDEVSVFTDLGLCLESIEADVAVDFTIPSTVYDHVLACLERGLNCVVGTTGLSQQQLDEIERQAGASGAKCFIAPNFAIGAVLLMQAARLISRHMDSVEIIELHHDQKLDAPSGTALRTADLMAEQRDGAGAPPGPDGNPARGMVYKGIPIHSVRLPGLVAHQEVIFGGKGQTLSLRHDSISRDSFMPGVVLAVRRIAGMDENLVVGLEKML